MNFHVIHTLEDEDYKKAFVSLFPGHSFSFTSQVPDTIISILHKTDAVLTTNPLFIKALTRKTTCNLEDYYGSFWLKENISKTKTPILALPPLAHIHTTKPGRFLIQGYLTKITDPDNWYKPFPFSWELCNDLKDLNMAYDFLSTCGYVAIDIETSPAYKSPETKSDPRHIITCVGYSGYDHRHGVARTFVVPCTSIENLNWIRKINQTDGVKIFQNGKYDNFYFLRFGAPVKNWLFDTMEAHHCSYSELPKNLGYISAFYLREVSYWKDEGKTGNLHDLYEYNAKDAWATLNCFFAWAKEAKPYAIKNYLIKWPLIYSCLACELRGIWVNPEVREKIKKEQEDKNDVALTSIRKKIAQPFFNPSSPLQVKSLLKVFGARGDSSAAKELEKIADKHPIFKRIIDDVKEYRESRKLLSTYIGAELWNGKLLYTLNPSGTDTGRLASKESQLWCGTQLQNLPEYFKSCLWASKGFFLGEGDYEQSESRCTAYKSGDENLIAAVSSSRDFHALNASAFFGVPYEKIVEDLQDGSHRTLDKTLRDLSKRTNHGATYNMGPGVMLATMGLKNVLRAQKLLNLSPDWKPLQVTEFLLKCFSDRYPVVKGAFYEYIVAQVKLTRMLVSDLGWTRFCFGTPWNSKPNLNEYVAHVPSNLSVGIINEAFVEAFWGLQIPSRGDFALLGQIHDSLLFEYRQGAIEYVHEMKRIMTKPKMITDCKGIVREMIIPVAMKAESECWGTLKKV